MAPLDAGQQQLDEEQSSGLVLERVLVMVWSTHSTLSLSPMTELTTSLSPVLTPELRWLRGRCCREGQHCPCSSATTALVAARTPRRSQRARRSLPSLSLRQWWTWLPQRATLALLKSTGLQQFLPDPIRSPLVPTTTATKACLVGVPPPRVVEWYPRQLTVWEVQQRRERRWLSQH